MKTILILASLLFINFLNLAGTTLNFEYDYCVFKNDDTSSFVEFYYSFLQSELTAVRNDNNYELSGFINLSIVSEQNREIINQSYKTPVTITDTSGYDWNTKLLGQINIILGKGLYRITITARDMFDSTKSFTTVDEIKINKSTDGLTFSSLQLATNVKRSENSKDVFYKNSLEVIPNPSRIFGKNLSDVYYYIELYNLSEQTVTNPYSIVKVIKDNENNEVKSGKNSYNIKNDSKVEYGYFNVADMKTGTYNLEIAVINSDNKKLLTQTNKFWVYNDIDTSVNSQYTDENEGYLLSEYKNYSETQLNDEINYISYIITDQFREQLRGTNDLEGKRLLLYNFWKKYDPNKSTTVNEFRNAYFERIKYSNKNFSSPFLEGWKTDRGRVYSLYGQPDNIDRHPFESDRKAYEEWEYNQIEGGVKFVFIDLSNNGDNYVLVHSTKKGELRDDNWQKKLDVLR